jgi:hypothetical protein
VRLGNEFLCSTDLPHQYREPYPTVSVKCRRIRQSNLCIFCNLCIFIVRSMYSYCSATLTEVFTCFFLSCKANARVQLANTGHGPHCYNYIFVLFYVLFFVLFDVFFVCFCCSVYCLCVNVYCTAATGCHPNCS